MPRAHRRTTTAPGTDVTRSQTEVLEHLAGAPNYCQWLAGLARPWLGADTLEVGSGTGDSATEWLAWTEHLTLTEGEPSRLAVLRRRFADRPSIDVRALTLPVDDEAAYSSVLAYNVLEHIEDDVAALASCRRLLAHDGHMVVLVPACPAAMSRFDREIGHYRRYTAASLSTALEAAGLELVQMRYVNAVGLLLWLVGMRLFGLRPGSGPWLGLFDRVVPALRRMESAVAPPFGQSIFAVAMPRPAVRR